MKSTTVGFGDLDKHLRAKRKKEAGLKDKVRAAEIPPPAPAPQPIQTKPGRRPREVSFTVGAPIEEPRLYRGRHFLR